MAYFKVQRISQTTWYISEPIGVGAYLFVGRDRALLSDTCNGFMDIRKTIGKITSLPLTVMNTHGHVDHAGGNNQFKEIYIHAADVSMLEPVWQKSQQDMLFGYAKKVSPLVNLLLLFFKLQHFKKYEPIVHTLTDGYTFDLGGRSLEVVHFPGHSPGSVMLADRETNTIYAGDAINHGLFLFFEGSPKLRAYAEMLWKFSQSTGYDYLRISHSKDPFPFSFVSYYADFLERVTLDKSELTDLPNGEKPVYKYKESGEKFSMPEISVHFTKEAI
jgi:glyoxylase-like metal-dependent hydrolase (beta-lactamase superfamily II)